MPSEHILVDYIEPTKTFHVHNLLGQDYQTFLSFDALLNFLSECDYRYVLDTVGEWRLP